MKIHGYNIPALTLIEEKFVTVQNKSVKRMF